ncbi:hypothetical protein THRCLA_08425 [Thraustotheca clavata]|uniref:Uncharacterized protein n=1 Tax=Thraustotheca clavata TaxID=74557 RepID=A0A1V9Z6I0_9STRA|nr:hypothetical protein THRCLA_08425 [Thraustotheca clavata]
MCFLVGISLIVSGIILISYGSVYLTYGAQRIAAVKSANFVPDPLFAGYSAFVQSPGVVFAWQTPQLRSYYVFNITNIDQVLAGNALPNVQQLGPYVYNESSTKYNIQLNTSYVSYSVANTYQFNAVRSNGSANDTIVTVNTTYARTLAKLQNAGFSERLLVASFAQTRLSAYQAYLQGPMIANTKQRLLGPYLNKMYQTVRANALPSVLGKYRDQVASQMLPNNLVHLSATLRQSYVPTLLESMYQSFLVNYVPATLSTHLTTLAQQSVPRVLCNLQNRLVVEAVPTMLAQRNQELITQAVPTVLTTILSRMPGYITFPYFARDMMEEACFEAVPSMLSTIKAGIVKSFSDQGQSPADAQKNTVLQWINTNGQWTDLDNLVGGNPTGSSRYGFELNSITVSDPYISLSVSSDVGNLLLGTASNKDFSLVDYTATDTTHGFGLWKRVVAMDASAIASVLSGINNEIADPKNFITQVQILGIRAYILSWSKGAVLHRDRQRYWATSYSQRNSLSSTEPNVDVDWYTTGVQSGFNLPTTNLALTDSQCAQLWNVQISPSFLDPLGYITWNAAASSSSAQSTLKTTFGLSTTQLNGILAWIQALTTSHTAVTNALRHWGLGGTCSTPFNNVTSCTMYNLEPSQSSVVGFELSNSANLSWPAPLVANLWDNTQTSSFLNSAGYQSWLNVGLLPTGLSSMTTTLNGLNLGTVTEDHVRQVLVWLQSWQSNQLLIQGMQQYWRDPTTFPMLPTSNLASLSTFLLNRPSLSAAVALYFWNPSSTYSMLNVQGYATWMTSNVLQSTILTAINGALTNICSQLVGGANSALFATQLVGSCSNLQLADITAIAAYIQAQNADSYMVQSFRNQWRCGMTTWNIELYRNGFELGLELCMNSSCNLAQVNGTICVVPTAASALWDASNSISFLNPQVYQSTWLALSSSNAAAATAAKVAITSGLGQSQWQPWMDVILQWLTSWTTSDYTTRDVLGLWLRSSCTATPTVVSQSFTPATTSNLSCSPSTTTTSNATEYTSALVGGRPNTYFAANYAESSYTDTPNIGLTLTTVAITCSGNTQTTTTTVKIVTSPICLMSDVTPELSGIQYGFELGIATTTISTTLVRQLWNATQPFSFLNMTSLSQYWVPASINAAKAAQLLSLIQVTSPGLTSVDLGSVIQWLTNWRQNQLMALYAIKQWVNPSTTATPFNLDPTGASNFTGFELRWLPAMSATTYPTIAQAQYLWGINSPYSFVNANGFNAWVQAYSGLLPGSEYLLDPFVNFPQSAQTTQVGNAAVITAIQSASGLTQAQIQAISQWLLSWTSHSFLWSVIMQQWLTSSTVFSTSPQALHLTALDSTGSITSLTGFEVATSATTSLTMTQAQQLWTISNAYSFLNPNMLIIWCFCHPTVAIACPHLSDASGLLSTTANTAALRTLNRYLGMYPKFKMDTSSPAAQALRFLSTVTGITSADITTIAVWLFGTAKSSFYRFLLQQQWANAGLAIYSEGFGYELSYIYNTSAIVPRNATSSIMISNSPTCAAIDALTAATLWDSTSATSFLNTGGLAAWLGGTVTIPSLLSCQKTQIVNWLASWQLHPFLRQYVEYNWYANPVVCTQSLYGCGQGFELSVPSMVNSSVVGTVATIVWDPQSTFSFLNPTGVQIWKTLLGGCQSSFNNGSCNTATIALPSANTFLVSTFSSLLAPVLVSDVRSAVYLVGQIWLIQMLDNSAFTSYVLQTTESTSIPSLAMQQFVNASVLSINISGDIGFATQKDIMSQVVWNTTTNQLGNSTLPLLPGFPELSVYCARQPTTFGVTPSCQLGKSYFLDANSCFGLFAGWNDQTMIPVNGHSIARGVIVLDVFLAQPFTSSANCVAQRKTIALAFPSFNVSTFNCIGINNNQNYLLNIPGLQPFQFTSLAPILDLQAYIKYSASVFQYPGSIANLYLGGLFVQTTVQSLLWQTATTSTLALSNIVFGPGDILTAPLTANVTSSQANSSTSITTYTFNVNSDAGMYGCLAALNNAPDPNNCTTSDGSILGSAATANQISFLWQAQNRYLTYNYSGDIRWIGVSTRRYFEANPQLWNASAIYDSLPVLSSPPHLMNISTSMVFATGMVPNFNLHQRLLDVEPLSGITLHKRDTWQLNVLAPATWLWHQAVQTSYIPLTWIVAEQAVTPSNIGPYKELSQPGPVAPEKVAIWEIVSGIVFVGLGFQFLRMLSRARYKDALLVKPVGEMPPVPNAEVADALNATELDSKTKCI